MNFPKTVIYMADDDCDDRDLMREALQEVNPNVTLVEAEDGYDLMTLLSAWSLQGTSSPINLILLDMNMPKINGLEALKAIKANPRLQHIPAVMLSTSVSPSEVANAYRSGISSYIQKPVSYADIVQIAQSLQVCFLAAAACPTRVTSVR